MSSFTLQNTANDIDSAISRVTSADIEPKPNSQNMVTSGGVHTALQEIAVSLDTVATGVTNTDARPASSAALLNYFATVLPAQIFSEKSMTTTFSGTGTGNSYYVVAGDLRIGSVAAVNDPLIGSIAAETSVHNRKITVTLNKDALYKFTWVGQTVGTETTYAITARIDGETLFPIPYVNDSGSRFFNTTSSYYFCSTDKTVEFTIDTVGSKNYQSLQTKSRTSTNTFTVTRYSAGGNVTFI